MYTSLSSCVIRKFFWTSHWKSNATCVRVRHMHPSCFTTLISFLHPRYHQNPWPHLWHHPRLQELISVLLLPREDQTLVPQCSTAFQQWFHILFGSVLVRYHQTSDQLCTWAQGVASFIELLAFIAIPYSSEHVAFSLQWTFEWRWFRPILNTLLLRHLLSIYLWY